MHSIRALSVILLILTSSFSYAQDKDRLAYTGFWDFFFPNTQSALGRRYEVVTREIYKRESRSLGTFGGIELQVRFSSFLDISADTYIIPRTGTGKGGDLVTGVVSWDAKEGLDEYDSFVKGEKLEWGGALLTKSGGNSKARHLIQIRTAPENEEEAFGKDDIARQQAVVRFGVFNALNIAHKNNLETIVLPPLASFNMEGYSLNPYLSAEAVAAGVNEFVQVLGSTHSNKTSVKKITVGVYPDSRFVNPAHQFLAYEREFSKLTGKPLVAPPNTLSIGSICRRVFSAN